MCSWASGELRGEMGKSGTWCGLLHALAALSRPQVLLPGCGRLEQGLEQAAPHQLAERLPRSAAANRSLPIPSVAVAARTSRCRCYPSRRPHARTKQLCSRPAGFTLGHNRVRSLFSPTSPLLPKTGGDTPPSSFPQRGREAVGGRELHAGWLRSVLPGLLATWGSRAPLPARLSLELSGCSDEEAFWTS